MPTLPENRRTFVTGLLAGLLAGIPTTGLMALFSLVGGASLPELLASTIALSLPLSLFETLRASFGADAKHYLYYIVLIGQCLIFALCGGGYLLLLKFPRFAFTWDETDRLRPLAGLLLGLLLWLFANLLFLPLTGGGLFGSELPGGIFQTTGSLAIAGITFGLLFVFIQHWLALRPTSSHEREHITTQRRSLRRGILVNGLKLLGLGALGTLAWRFISEGFSAPSPSTSYQPPQSRITPPPQPAYGTLSDVPGHSPEITPADDFYVVSKNFVSDPSVNQAGWKLTIDGAVTKPYSLTYNDLLALPQQQQYETLMCISNPVGGDLMGNAFWEGVPLSQLLAQAGNLDEAAADIILHGADEYTDSIPLTKALEPATLVALHMNNAPLTQAHGFPARLMVPGIYGMKHVKWLQRIEVVTSDYLGYWQKSGWSDPAPVRMTTRIDTPRSDAILDPKQKLVIAGIAFSGDKGISQVNVSTDDGRTWQQATLKRPPSAITWVLWEVPWQSPQSGSYRIIAYAVDLDGNVQSPEMAPPAPAGSSGYHRVQVTVR